jgi:hypothetical protein
MFSKFQTEDNRDQALHHRQMQAVVEKCHGNQSMELPMLQESKRRHQISNQDGGEFSYLFSELGCRVKKAPSLRHYRNHGENTSWQSGYHQSSKHG